MKPLLFAIGIFALIAIEACLLVRHERRKNHIN